ncbi:MAG TPA: phage tail tape measure protein, partial [Kiritimatiellia bacterium]|nr:phage tail tape measure protein [Kiritimatiellia bacterium]
EIKGMGGDPGRSQLEEKLGLQQKAVENLQKAVDAARTKLQGADTDAQKLLAAKQLSGLETQLATAEAKALSLKNQLSAINYIKWGGMISGFGRAMQRMGQKFTMYVGAPLAALGISSFNAFKDYELALARLKSALPDAGEEIEKLNQAALEMSETIPVSYEEIMAIMTSLAKAGVPVGEIDGMTMALARMSAVTGMTAEEVGTSMVMFMNSMGLPMGNVDQLGAALMQLADTSIATEADIFDMATRMAATGSLAGLSATEVLSLAAAFASMGVDAQAGGSAASKLMKQMQLAAETGKDVEGFAKVMGVSAEQFTAGWNQSPADSMLAFFQGLSDMDTSGQQSVLAMLDEMGLTEIRLSNLVALGAKNPDMFESLMGTGAKGFEDNTALVKKAGDIFNTTSGEMDMLGNSVRNAQADLGENVADTFQPLIDKVGELVGKFSELDEDTQTRWVEIAGALVLLGPAAVGIGNVAKGIGSLVTFAGKIKSGEVTLFSKLIGALAGPAGGWLLAAAGVAGVVAALNSIQTPAEQIIDGLKNIVIGLDEESYNTTMAALAEVKAQTDALSGEKGEYNKNISAAVKRGHGTADMYGTALGYEAMLTQSQIAEIAGRYSDKYEELNAAIGAAKTDADAKRAAEERDALKANWDAEVAQAKANYMAQVSALVSGMMQGQPEVKAALEQAAKDYDLLAALENVTRQVMATDDMAAVEALWAGFFTPDIMNKYFEGQSIKNLAPPTAVDVLRQELISSLKTSLEKAGGDESLAYTLLQSILTDPLAAGLYDATLTQGALDGLVELLDFKNAAEQSGVDFGDALTPGLSDAITDSIPDVSGAMDSMQTQLVSQAAAMGAAVAAAFNNNVNFRLPNAGGGGVNVNVNSPTAMDIYNIRKGLTDASRRAARGYGAG